MCIFRCVVSIVPWIQTRSKINTPQSIFRKARYFAQKSSYRTSREEPRSSRGTKPSVPAGVSEGGLHGGAVSRLQRFLLSHRLAVATIKTTRISCMHVHHPSVVPSWKTQKAPIHASAVIYVNDTSGHTQLAVSLPMITRVLAH